MCDKNEKYLTKEECLNLDVSLYNEVMELQWKTDKVDKNLSGDLSTCTDCGRKYIICCICETAEIKWDNMMKEVNDISNRDRSKD